jgi:Skp family chaperone for outer membrane proteins
MTIRAIAAAALAASVLVLAPARGGAAEPKIGFVDLRKAVFASREGKAAQEQFGKLEEAKAAELRPRQEELRKLEEEYEKQKFVLSPEALQDRRFATCARRRTTCRSGRCSSCSRSRRRWPRWSRTSASRTASR